MTYYISTNLLLRHLISCYHDLIMWPSFRSRDCLSFTRRLLFFMPLAARGELASRVDEDEGPGGLLGQKGEGASGVLCAQVLHFLRPSQIPEAFQELAHVRSRGRKGGSRGGGLGGRQGPSNHLHTLTSSCNSIVV